MRLASTSLCVFLLCQVASSQPPSSAFAVSEPDARQHLLRHAEPIYPAIARAINLQGDVAIALVISPTGEVVSEKAVSGPSMLQQAALDAVRTWHFTPFQVNSAATQATTMVTIPFHIDQPGTGPSAEQQKAAQALFPLSSKCRDALKAQNPQESLDSCKQALHMSFKAGDMSSSDQLMRMDSYELYGRALLAAGKAQQALEQENLAIEESRKCLKATDEEYGMPFFWRAMVEAQLGHADAALADFGTAEETHRQAILHLPEMKSMYSKYLASILKRHAALLDQLGRPADAEKLRAEAASL